MANRLQAAASPYLQQHAADPVDWYPWGSEALARARTEQRPILLSIGYAACHWCHVMAHESFADAGIAERMNRLFICIKVDREERPDLDRIYQQAHQLLNGRPGGWPLTVVLTPDDLLPFFCGTYLPKSPRHGLPGFGELLERIHIFWQQRPELIRTQNAQLAAALHTIAASAPSDRPHLTPAPLAALRPALLHAIDPLNGGFGSAPKFPQVNLLARLQRIAYDARCAGTVDVEVEDSLRRTLRGMCFGGLCDQIGGGFFRYSVDARWEIPHFEKMLYDQALLIPLLADAVASQLCPELSDTLERSVDFLQRELLAAGGLCATLDADSDGGEGRYYLWTPESARAAGLDAEHYALAAACWGLDAPANFEGVWHVRQRRSTAELATTFGLDPPTVATRLAHARMQLLTARARRSPPARDDKQLTAWNALAISALARSGRLLAREDWIELATKLHAQLRGEAWRNGRLYAVRRHGQAYQAAFLDDYAFLLDASLELLQCRWNAETLGFTVALADRLLDQFEDRDAGGCYFSPHDAEPLPARPKPLHDETLPSANGITARCLLQLGHLLGQPRYLRSAERILEWAWPALESRPLGCATLLAALEEYCQPALQVRLHGEAAACRSWWEFAVRQPAARRCVFAIGDANAALPAVLQAPRIQSAAVCAQICRGAHCDEPLTDFDAFTAALSVSQP